MNPYLRNFTEFAKNEEISLLAETMMEAAILSSAYINKKEHTISGIRIKLKPSTFINKGRWLKL